MLDKYIGKNLPTANLILIFIGYEFFTTLFLPNSYGADLITRIVTVPLRVICLGISLYVIYDGLRIKNRVNVYVKMLVIFYALYVFLVFIHITLFATTVAAQYENKNEYYLFVIGLTFIPLLSIVFSCERINYRLFYKYVYLLVFITVSVSVVSNGAIANEADLSGIRQQGNIALNTIGYGHLGVSLFLLSVYGAFYMPRNKNFIIINLASAIMGLYVVIMAASRGPLISLIVAVCLLVYSQKKSRLLFFLLFISVLLIFSISGGLLYDLLGEGSPLVSRIENTGYESEVRSELFYDAWSQFLSSPIIGEDFVLLKGFGAGWYPHNLILEAFMVMGFMGGTVMILLVVASLRSSVMMFKNYDEKMLVVFFYIQYLVMFMVSGSLCAAGKFFSLMAIVLVFDKKKDFGFSLKRY